MSEPSDKARELVVALTGACMGFGNTGESEDLREANRLEAALLDYLASLEERAGEVLAEARVYGSEHPRLITLVRTDDGPVPLDVAVGAPVAIVRRQSEEEG